jgi:hypothetical protein
MNDIVERLLKWPATPPRGDAFSSHFVGDMLVEAAAEIEQLRRDLAHAKAVSEVWINRARRLEAVARTTPST